MVERAEGAQRAAVDRRSAWLNADDERFADDPLAQRLTTPHQGTDTSSFEETSRRYRQMTGFPEPLTGAPKLTITMDFLAETVVINLVGELDLDAEPAMKRQ